MHETTSLFHNRNQGTIKHYRRKIKWVKQEDTHRRMYTIPQHLQILLSMQE